MFCVQLCLRCVCAWCVPPATCWHVAALSCPPNHKLPSCNRHTVLFSAPVCVCVCSILLQENHALYQRLVAIRPSKDISRDTLEAGYRQNEIYRDNCTQFKPAHSKTAAAAQTH